MIFSWMGVLVLLTGIGLLTHLEWARPKVEQAMDDAFHRHVRLGQISWMLGLNGLSIWTDRLTMTEQNGKPFIVAGESEIGVAFIPLLQKRVIIKHVEFHHPEVYATQVAPGKWNFSDLLVQGPEIHYVEVDDGVFHLRNEVASANLARVDARDPFASSLWRSYDLQDVCIKLIFPRAHQKHPWPFYLTFKLPHQSGGRQYLSCFSITLLCNGQLEKWREHPCRVDLMATNLNPADWRPFLPVPDGMDGLLSFSFHGEGTPNTTIEGTLTGGADDARLVNDATTIFAAPQISFSSNLKFTADTLSWDKLKVKIASIDLDSHGTVNGWRSADPSYQAVMSADLKNLSKASDTSFFKLLPGFGQPRQQDLSGSAQVELAIQGDRNTRNISTRLKADGIPLSNLISGDSQKAGAPLLSLFKIEPDTPIAGQILIDKDQTITLNDIRIPANGSTLRIHGVVNAARKSHDVEVSSENLVLDKFDTAQLERGESPSILLSGKVDLSAHLLSGPSQQEIDIKAKLKGASLSSGQDVVAYGLKGTVVYDGRAIKFQHVSGIVDNDDGTSGSVVLDGSLQTGKQPCCALFLTGKKVDIADLLKMCHLAHLPLSQETIGNLSGTARDIEIKIKGTGKVAQCLVHLTPEEMRYRMSSASGGNLKPLKINGGSIGITSSGLELKDLPVAAPGGKLMLTASFVGTEHGLMAKTIHAKSSGIGVDDLQTYLCSPDLPDSTRHAFGNVLAPMQFVSVKGKVVGDLTLLLGDKADSPCQMDGNFAFSAVSGKIFQHIPFDRLSGTVLVHGDAVQMQDIAFMSGASRVHLSGDLKGIQETPQWNLLVSSQCKPEDLVNCMPPGMAKGIQASATGHLGLRATISGDEHAGRIAFSAQGRPGCNVKLGGEGWQLWQPASQPVNMDGTLALRFAGNSSSVKLEGGRLFIGDALLQTGGKYEWQSESDRLSSMELTMTTPQAVSAPILLSAVVPGLDTTGGAGAIKGSLAFAGMEDHLLTHGDFVLKGVSLPAVNLKDVDGSLHSPRWSIVGNSDHGNQSQLAIQIRNATVAGVPVHNLSGTVVLDGGAQPCLTLDDGQGSLAGGRINVVGAYHLNSQSWSLDLSMSQLQIDEFVTDLIERSGEVTGLADGHVKLEGHGTDWNQAVTTLRGSGHIEVAKGTVPKVAALQEKLSQANLLHQGIFGFNLNNVLQTVLPVKAGKFKEANVAFNINDGVVAIDRLNFVGSDLRLRAAGDWDIPRNVINLEVAGNIPRVASSILPGAVGQVSRNLTIQKAVNVVTFNKLERLPSVPILGDIGADEPRAFTFKIACGLEKPDGMQQSISKTFRWLPNKASASAHPIPHLIDINLNL